MTQYTFQIDIEPQCKQSARFAKIGNFIRSYQPKKIKDYAEFVKNSFLREYPNHIPLKGLLFVKIECFFAIPKSYSKKKIQIIAEQNYYAGIRKDCDNLSKLNLDALNGVAWLDDKQIVSLNIEKKYSEFGHTIIHIMEM